MVVGRSAVYYAFVKRAFTEDGKATLDRLARILKGHPGWSVEIMGHCDNDEVAEGKINPRFADTGRKRADQVKRYLVSQGVGEGQLSVMGVENADPASTKDSDLARARTAASRSASSKEVRLRFCGRCWPLSSLLQSGGPGGGCLGF